MDAGACMQTLCVPVFERFNCSQAKCWNQCSALSLETCSTCWYDDTILTWAQYGEILVNHSKSMSQISLVYVRNVFLWIHIVFIYVICWFMMG